MMEGVRMVREEEEGISVMQALQILSRNAHRNTSRWEFVEKQVFKNGRLEETHEYVISVYDVPDSQFEPAKFLVFEAIAMAKAYIMDGIEEQLASIRGEDEEEYED
jgi:hypothetical protein